MKNIFLVHPNNQYQKSFQNYVLSYEEIKDNHYFNKYKKALENYDEYLVDLHNFSKGINLLQGEVKTSVFWLIDKEEVVGVVRIRHEELDCAGHIGYDISPLLRNKGYGTEILRLALEKAKNIGISEVIVTCNVDNTASRRIIEKNNGKLLGIVFDEEENEELNKFSINISNI